MNPQILSPLPHDVRDLLNTLNASPRLVAHVTLMHQVMRELTRAIDRTWPDLALEDLLVALADTIWKGKRDEQLEATLTQNIAHLRGEECWAVFLALDEIVRPIAEHADDRLAWQAQHPV